MDLEHHQVFMSRKATKCSIFPRSNPQVEWLILGWTWTFKKINTKTSITKYKDTLCLLHKKMMIKTLDSSTSEQASTMRRMLPLKLIGQVARSLLWKTSSLRLDTHHSLAHQKQQIHQCWMTQDANQRDLISISILLLNVRYLQSNRQLIWTTGLIWLIRLFKSLSIVMSPKNYYRISMTQVLMTWRRSFPKKLPCQNSSNMLMLTSKDSINTSCKKWLVRLAVSSTFNT